VLEVNRPHPLIRQGVRPLFLWEQSMNFAKVGRRKPGACLVRLVAVLSLLVLGAGTMAETSPAGKGTPELRNVALGKPVRGTSTGFWRNPASHVTDGNPESFWRASSGDPLPYYLEVDLQAGHEIERIDLVEGRRGGSFRLTRFGLFSSSDGVLWDKLGGGTVIGEGISVEFAPHRARWVRLVVEEDDGLDLPMIGQIAVWSRSDPDIAPAAVARRSRGAAMRSFGLSEPPVRGEIGRPDWPVRSLVRDESGRYRMLEQYDSRIAVVVSAGTPLGEATAYFETSGATAVYVGEERQESGVTPNDFRRTVTYRLVAEDGTEAVYSATAHEQPAEATVTVHKQVIGRTMDYVGYSAMNLTEGDNLSHWYGYSKVNGVRYWLTPMRQVGRTNVTADQTVIDADQFDRRKEALREGMSRKPLDSRWIDWDGVGAKFDELFEQGERHTAGYALRSLRELGIEIIAALNDSHWAEPFADEAERWQRAWVLWQMFYAQSYILAKEYDVWHFQGPNEPEFALGRFSGTGRDRKAAVDRFVFMNAIYSDAMRAAVEDVNRIYGKDLRPVWGAPTLASNPTSDVSVATLRANRTNYRGEEVAHNITDWFIMQSYSSDPSFFLKKNASAREVMETRTPTGDVLPLAYTEFNFLPGSVWRSQNFTSDDPRVFLPMARVWAESMADGLYGMFQFRIGRPINFGGNHMHHMFRTPRDPAKNLLYGRPYTVSSESEDGPLRDVLKNATSDRFGWRTGPGVEGPHWAEWDLGEWREIRGFVVNIGTVSEGIDHGALQYWSEAVGQWRTFPGGEVRKGSPVEYGGAPRPMPTHNSRIHLSSVPTVNLVRALAEPVVTRRIRFVSESTGPIVVRRIFVADHAHGGEIGGPMKSAEVTRLFAEGFGGGRPRLATTAHVGGDSSYAAYAAWDSGRQRHTLWLPQTSDWVDYNTTIDYSEWVGSAGGLVTIREVSATHFGDVVYRGPLGDDGTLVRIQPRSSLWMVTLEPEVEPRPVRVVSTDRAQIGLGSWAETALPVGSQMVVSQNTQDLDRNRAVYLKYDLGSIPSDRIATVLLRVQGWWETAGPGGADPAWPESDRFTLHAYGLEDHDWHGATLTGADAPNFGRGDSVVAGSGARPLAVMSFGREDGVVTADVTDWFRSRAGEASTLVLVRERRHENEITDTEFIRIHASSSDAGMEPHLEVWLRAAGD